MSINRDKLLEAIAAQTMQIARLVESVDRLVATLADKPAAERQWQHTQFPFSAPTPGAPRPPSIHEDPKPVPVRFAPRPGEIDPQIAMIDEGRAR